MDCPTLVISRHPANGDPGHANSPARFGPRSARSRVLQPLSGAGACLQFCRSKEAHCILQVTVDRVVAAALELLFERRKASADKMPAAFDGVAVHAVDDLQPTREMVSC
jgi:heptosyltransferase-2